MTKKQIHVWLCDCGIANDVSYATCRDCGNAQSKRERKCPNCRFDPEGCGLRVLRQSWPKGKLCDYWQPKGIELGSVGTCIPDPPKKTAEECEAVGNRPTTHVSTCCDEPMTTAEFLKSRAKTCQFTFEIREAGPCEKVKITPTQETYIWVNGGRLHTKTWLCSCGTRNDVTFDHCQSCEVIRGAWLCD